MDADHPRFILIRIAAHDRSSRQSHARIVNATRPRDRGSSNRPASLGARRASDSCRRPKSRNLRSDSRRWVPISDNRLPARRSLRAASPVIDAGDLRYVSSAKREGRAQPTLGVIRACDGADTNKCSSAHTITGGHQMDDLGLWGRELRRISDQVRTWPPAEQRSAAIRGLSPQRHSAEGNGTQATSHARSEATESESDE